MDGRLDILFSSRLDFDMPAERRHLLVARGDGAVGRHLCRFAVSMGHRVTALSPDGRPGTGEPWEEGVDWHRIGPGEWRTESEFFEDIDAVVAALEPTDASDDTLLELADLAREAGVPRFVLLSPDGASPDLSSSALEARRDLEAELMDSSGSEAIVILHAPPGEALGAETSTSAVSLVTHGDESNPLDPIPVEQIAIAALRAALEPDHGGILSSGEVADLGEAAMIQS